VTARREVGELLRQTFNATPHLPPFPRRSVIELYSPLTILMLGDSAFDFFGSFCEQGQSYGKAPSKTIQLYRATTNWCLHRHII